MKEVLQKIKQGFTLVEILVVVVIIGILAAIAIPTYFRLTENTYAKEAEIQISNMVKSAGQYKLEEGTLPGDCWETMLETGHIEITEAVTDAWEFECSWDWDQNMSRMEGTVSATSTDENGAGPGNTVTYTIEENEYTGFGQGNSY